MTTVRRLTPLEAQIVGARAAQQQARACLQHSANNGTIAAEKKATRELNVLLDRLSAAIKNR